MNNHNRALFIAGTFLAAICSGQNIAITGTVVDSSTAQPITGAAVRLVDIPAITALTNSAGTFTLAGAVATIEGQTTKSSPATIVVGRTTLFLAGLTPMSSVDVDLFNTAGARIFHAEKRVDRSGSAIFSGLAKAQGMFFGRVSFGNGRPPVNYVMTTMRSSQATIALDAEAGHLLKANASHTIEVSKSGYYTRQVAFSSEAGDAGTIKLALSTAPYDWVGIIGTGQSLSVGCGSTAPVNTTQPFHNLKLQDAGPDPKYPVYPLDSAMAVAKWSVIPLTEPIRAPVAGYGTCTYPPDNCGYPNNIYLTGETPHSGMANALSMIWRTRTGGDYITAHSVIGVGGAGLQYINKGNGSYQAALSETHVYTKLAKAAGKTYGVAGIILTHGEADGSNQAYETGLYQFWQDYNHDLKAITGQTRDVVMFGSQQSTTSGSNSSAVQLWRAGVDHPGQIICIGPKYQYTYSDGLHLNQGGYERLGEKHGEVFDLVINQNLAWKPLSPASIGRSGATITVTMNVPNPPLVWDTHISTPTHAAWVHGRGFEVADSAGNDVSIASVQIQNSTVVVTLSQAPAAGAKLIVSYATANDNKFGELRDSDGFVGPDSETIAVKVTSGSAQIQPVTAGAFYRRCGYDMVGGASLVAGTIVTTATATVLTLSSNWTGATGTAQLLFYHNQYNYCVHFSMPVAP